ncbi:hypothetical protein AWM70_13060 [Paenibacillus yonginensis]|uniref:Uncharacterized protein n=1 Tax=Paenibacillus yonginensis TaxID=1462996 RepID=A0A1B1N1Y4_9BACL|nr:hypothetical protein [Paenibacillus yonginensis]ANS75425.1 hypothetical protein AWM70_13060 [Paenibacillus yonginensis]
MGSSEPYNEEIREIDEQILALVHQRRSMPPKGSFMPSEEQVRIWAEKWNLSEIKIYELVRAMNRPPQRRTYSNFSGELRTVVPLMKQTDNGNFRFHMTHMMQYANWSELHLKVNYEGELDDNVSLNLNLNLDIAGGEAEYTVRRGSGGQSPSGEAAMTFLIEPPLPDELAGLDLLLVPFEPVFQRPVELQVLQEPIKLNG